MPSTPFNKRLGAAIRARRIECGLNQTDVGNALGVTFQQIQKIERGINRLSSEGLVIIAKALDTTPQTLIDAAGEPANQPAKGDRVRLETARCLNALPPERFRTALNVIKALAKEEAA